MQREITLEEKLKYLEEVENIYRLSKKTLPPKGKTWKALADQVLRRALGASVVEKTANINMTKGRQMHLHSPRTARLVERTLRNGDFHPDVLHAYRGNGTSILKQRQRIVPDSPPRKADTLDIAHITAPSGDFHYPDGHMQGFGFVPNVHEFKSHVELERSKAEVVPSAKSGYH